MRNDYFYIVPISFLNFTLNFFFRFPFFVSPRSRYNRLAPTRFLASCGGGMGQVDDDFNAACESITHTHV